MSRPTSRPWTTATSRAGAKGAIYVGVGVDKNGKPYASNIGGAGVSHKLAVPTVNGVAQEQ